MLADGIRGMRLQKELKKKIKIKISFATRLHDLRMRACNKRGITEGAIERCAEKEEVEEDAFSLISLSEHTLLLAWLCLFSHVCTPLLCHFGLHTHPPPPPLFILLLPSSLLFSLSLSVSLHLAKSDTVN